MSDVTKSDPTTSAVMERQNSLTSSWYSTSSRLPSDSPSPSSSFREDRSLLQRKHTLPFVFVSGHPYRTSSLDDIHACYAHSVAATTGRAEISRHRYGRRSQYSEYSTRRKNSLHSRTSSVRSSRNRRNSCGLDRSRPASSRSRKISITKCPQQISPSVEAAEIIDEQSPSLVYNDEIVKKQRRHRIAVWLLLGSFIFIAASSILVVVVTLTHQSEYNNTMKYYTFAIPYSVVRKENEELMNSLNRESSYNSSSMHVTQPPQPILGSP
ncbi:hypothetical protein CBL_04698 [Carabus blaptoides fortunei]